MEIKVELSDEEMNNLMGFLHEEFKKEQRLTVNEWIKADGLTKQKLQQLNAAYEAKCKMENREYTWKDFCNHIGIIYRYAVKYHIAHAFTQSLIDDKIIEEHMKLNEEMYQKLFTASEKHREKWEKKAAKKKNKGKKMKEPHHDVQLTKVESEDVYKKMNLVDTNITKQVTDHVREHFQDQPDERKKLWIKLITRLLCKDLRLGPEMFREYPIVRYEMKSSDGVSPFGLWDWVEFTVKHVPDETILLWLKSVDEYYQGFKALSVSEQTTTTNKMSQLKI